MGGGASKGNAGDGGRVNSADESYDDEAQEKATKQQPGQQRPAHETADNDSHGNASQSRARPDFIQTQQHPVYVQPTLPQQQIPIQNHQKPAVNGPRHDAKSNDY